MRAQASSEGPLGLRDDAPPLRTLPCKSNGDALKKARVRATTGSCIVDYVR